VYGREGVEHLLKRAAAYNQAAIHGPWILLLDLDHRGTCAPELMGKVLPNPAPHMCFRIAVRQIEAWLLADRERIAEYLGVRQARVPADPDALEDPKQAMVDLAAASSRSLVRREMVPRPGGGRQTGPAYAGRLIEFASDPRLWRPRVAAESSQSLRKAANAIGTLVTGWRERA
jgi:hypothetical protein